VVTSGYARPSTCAFFAGRVFYAGVTSGEYSNKVYFSQIVKKPSDFGKCHQTNDPTSEYSFDLLPTDGGVIPILDCGTILKLVSIQSALVIFATNGVWAINGSQGIGFTANDFQVRKVSSIPCLSPSSFVEVAGMPAWWNSDGIYAVAGTDAYGQFQITPLSEKKIKGFFNDEIPVANKAYAKGAFNPLTKVVQWLYRSTAETSITTRYEFDKVLCLNTVTGAFYSWSLGTTNVSVNGIVGIHGQAADTEEETVYVGSAEVTVGGVNVTTEVTTTVERAGVFKYLCSYPSGGSHRFTFAEEYDTGYVDFYGFNNVGTGYQSYFITGFKIRGEGQKKFQNNYLTLYVDNETSGKLYFRSVWDYATNSALGDYGTRQLVQWRSTVPRDYQVRKLKIRGSGRSLQFRVDSLPGENFAVTGWASFETSNTAP
jgi:hypothetical protein